jgi:pimeloyl-ACP methyl ester carboxylesterase
MKNIRIWGDKPYQVAVVHGGPGTPGHMAPVARELSKDMGILEPLQTKDTVDGQVEELADVLKKYADIPVVLVGHSWGAILSAITAARFPEIVKKLILIGAAPLDVKDAPDYTKIRFERLSEEKKAEVLSLGEYIWDGATEDKSKSLKRFFGLLARGDAYDLLPYEDEVLEYQLDINVSVGAEMGTLLTSGRYLELSRQITCPVVAIYGDYDPRPAELVRESFSRVHKDFEFILLEKCGHTPWTEKHARKKFFTVLRKEIV